MADTWKQWHDQFGVNANDKWFVVAGNPNQNSGGIVASTNFEFKALDIKNEAIKQGYKNVRVVSWVDLWVVHEEER